MADIEKLRKLIFEKLTDKRYKHSIGVEETSVALAKKYGADIEKAQIAGILHDIAKDLEYATQLQMCEEFGIIISRIEKSSPSLLHSITGAYYIKNEIGIDDEEILNAVRYHTTGRANMTMLEKIIFLADFIEPNRDFLGVEKVRPIAFFDIDRAMIIALSLTIEEVLNKKEALQVNTLECYNDLILKMKGDLLSGHN